MKLHRDMDEAVEHHNAEVGHRYMLRMVDGERHPRTGERLEA